MTSCTGRLGSGSKATIKHMEWVRSSSYHTATKQEEADRHRHGSTNQSAGRLESRNLKPRRFCAQAVSRNAVELTDRHAAATKAQNVYMPLPCVVSLLNVFVIHRMVCPMPFSGCA